MSTRRAPAVGGVVLVLVAVILAVAPPGLPGRAALERAVGAYPVLVDGGPLPGDLRAALRGAGPVLGVAHNAGNRPGPARAAARAGADVLEVDVVLVGDELRAGRPLSMPLISQWLFRGPGLDDVWRRNPEVPLIELDLKDPAPSATQLVAAFLVERRGERPVLVASRSAAQLLELRRRVPDVRLLLSIGTAGELAQVRADPAVLAGVDGVTVSEALLDPETIAWLGADDRLLVAWTVNDRHRAADLVRAGVDAVTTDDLALLRALSDRVPSGPGSA